MMLSSLKTLELAIKRSVKLYAEQEFSPVLNSAPLTIVLL